MPHNRVHVHSRKVLGPGMMACEFGLTTVLMGKGGDIWNHLAWSPSARFRLSWREKNPKLPARCYIHEKHLNRKMHIDLFNDLQAVPNKTQS